MPALLEVRDLRVRFAAEDGPVDAVRGVSFTIERGETLAIVGESGSGKSVTALSVLQLLPYPRASHPSGSIRLAGDGLLGADERRLMAVRGRRVGMIFQEPMTSLNPLHTVERQIGESLRLHRGLGAAEARRRTLELLDLVRIPLPEQRLGSYPHQLSGGQRQRVMIAMALANEPDILIADEPTTALDVTIQAQILELLRELRDKLGTAVLLITHDLGVVAETCDRVLVMYAGRMAEGATAEQLFRRPLHPYTRGLMRAIPRLDIEAEAGGRRPRLKEIGGLVPSLSREIPGCAFAPRCEIAIERCRVENPTFEETGNGHRAACHEWRQAAGATV